MKIVFCWILFFTPQLFSQFYLNLYFINGSYKYSSIGSLNKITLSIDCAQMNFHLSDGTIISENISEIMRITTDNIPLGEPLPVELSMFSATINGNQIILTWKTETEVCNYGFEIERSAQANDWEKIGFVKGNGNSYSPKEYSFTDSPEQFTNFQYRLKQIDTDGLFKYSNIVSVNFNIPLQFELKQNFPNPFNPVTNIYYNLPADGFVTIKVYDLLANEIITLINEEKSAGNYFTTFDGSELSSGVYICTMVAKNFNKSIKMLMLK